MSHLKQLVVRLVKEEQGASLIEYVLLAALIALAAIGTMTTLGTNISDKFQDVADEVAK